MLYGIRDVGLLLARLGFAFALIPHGWNKLYESGFSGTADGFAQYGIPFPEISAGVAIAGEFGGSILLALGLITPIAGLVAAITMFGAVLTAPEHLFAGAHFSGGLASVFSENWKGASALVFGALALALAVSGPGRFSFDNYFFGRPEWFVRRA